GGAGGRGASAAPAAPRARRDPPGLRDSLAQPARPDRRARRVTPVRHRQFGSSPVRIAFAAETTKSWLVLFARAVRPTERSARLPARQQPGYVSVGDLVIAWVVSPPVISDFLDTPIACASESTRTSLTTSCTISLRKIQTCSVT